MSEKSFTASKAGPVVAEINIPHGIVFIDVDPKVTSAKVTVKTDASSGSLADAVAQASITQEVIGKAIYVRVKVPEVQGVTTMQTRSGATLSFGGSITGNFINMGGAGGANISIGGVQVVRDGVVVAEQGAQVGGSAARIEVHVTLPAGSSVWTDTVSAGVRAAGHSRYFSATSVSGETEIESVQRLIVETTSGAVAVRELKGRGDVVTTSGSVDIADYTGVGLSVVTVSGSVYIGAGSQSAGSLRVKTISGDIRTVGARHLYPQVATVSGRKTIN